MITRTCYAKRNSMGTSMEDVISEKTGRKMVGEEFKLIYLVGFHRCSAVWRFREEGGHKWTARPLRITQDTCRDNQTTAQTKETKLPLLTNTSGAIVRMSRSLLSVMEAILIYAGTFKLQICFLLAEYCIKNIIVDMVSLHTFPGSPVCERSGT